MKKQETVNYLNSIKEYLNLYALCSLYNEKYSENCIDYNNLRSTLNGNAPNRVSEEKLTAFYDFLTKDVFQDIFKVSSNEVCSMQIEQIIREQTKEMMLQISEELKHGFSNK